LRSGLIDKESYLELLAHNITRVMRRSGRLKQTVEESSFDAWTKFYKQDENAPNSIVSYYAKGAIIALALDLSIRRDSSGEKSLDDLMRSLWLNHGKPDIGVGEADVERLAAEVTGLDLSDFFQQALRTTEDLPIESLLQTVAVGYELRPATGSKDEGGLKKSENKPSIPKADLGVLYKADHVGAKLTAVMDYGPAMQAGLSAGDVVIALDGIKVTSTNLDQLLQRAQLGEKVEIYAFRRDELRRFEVEMRPAEPNTCYLWLQQDITKEQQIRVQSWMNQ
jgi:predicted metalloprotease with PDZ domain